MEDRIDKENGIENKECWKDKGRVECEFLGEYDFFLWVMWGGLYLEFLVNIISIFFFSVVVILYIFDCININVYRFCVFLVLCFCFGIVLVW